MGRDSFYRLLRAYGLMLGLKKRRVRTTDSTHPYPRYYVRLRDGRFCFLSLITDTCSRRITGWKLAPTLEQYIDSYNSRRPHASIDFLTPVEAEQRQGPLWNRWKRKKGGEIRYATSLHSFTAGAIT